MEYSNYCDDEGSDDNLNNFIDFTASIGSANFFYGSVSKNIDIDDETYKLNDNENLQEAFNKILKCCLPLRKRM